MTDHYLVYSSLYPNPLHPVHGIFVQELCRALAETHPVTVIAPVNGLRNISRRSKLKQKPSASACRYLQVFYPLFWTFPRVLKQLDARLMAWSTQKTFASIARTKPALVHAHYAYPEAAAASLLCRRWKLPLVITIHGSDMNVIARDPRRQPQIIQTLRNAAAVVCVAQNLVEKARNLAGPDVNLHHIPNGVSLENFLPGNQQDARNRLGLSGHKKVLLTVGRLDPVKAYDRLILSMKQLPESTALLMVGGGSEQKKLEELVQSHDLGDRILFAGMIDHHNLRTCYQAADLLVITSHSEGWPTIIFESLACGTPVVAHAVGGIPEILDDPDLGLLMPDNTPETIAACLRKGLNREWNPEKAVQVAGQNSWNNIARQYLRLYHSILTEKGQQEY